MSVETDELPKPIAEFREKYVEKGRDHPDRDVEAVRDTAEDHVRYIQLFREWLHEQDKGLYDDDVNVRDIRRFRNWLTDEHDYSDGTKRNITGSVSQFFQTQRPDDENPVRAWSQEGKSGKWSYTTEKEREERQEVFYLSEDQVDALLEHATTFRSELIIRTLVNTGIRRSELVTLRCDDVYPEERRIRVYDTKNNEYRGDVGFRSEKLARDLRMWLDHRRQREFGADETDHLFPPGNAGAEKDHLSAATVGATVRKAAASSGIQEPYTTDSAGRVRHKVTPHTLRATFAVHAAKKGVSAPVVRDALGHHDLSITDIYTSLAEGDAADVIRTDGPSF